MFNISCSGIASAASSIPDKEVEVKKEVINEYDKYKKLKNTNVNSLMKKGYLKAEAEELKSFDYVGELKKKIEKNSKLDDTTLIKMGYTNEQIEAIRNFTGTEQQIYLLSAELWLSTYVLSHSHSSSYSQATFRTDWS